MFSRVQRMWIKLPVLIVLGLSLNACKMGDRRELTQQQQRFRNMGLALVVDAVEDAKMLGVEFFADGHEFPFYARGLQWKGSRAIMAYPGGVVPEQVRVVWHDDAKYVERPGHPGNNMWGGKVVGDYTIPVASRIPDSVLKEIRQHGGGLRLKFRLKPDGVMFGWDIERFEGGLPHHTMAGGDFLQTRY